jgi:ribulose-5-phosphate 4-epimerase/fuculose-1-phosphate aldolase
VSRSSDAGLVAGLVHAGRTVVAAGLVVGSGGNLSARHPRAELVRVTAAEAWLDRLDADALPAASWLDAPGPPSADAAPTSEFALHRAVYRCRPDVNAVIHLHPQTTVLLDSLGERVRLITTDHAFYVRHVATTPFHPPGSDEVAAGVAAAVADGTNCVILAHHGCAVVADTVELALRRALNLEEAARLTYRALLLTGALTDHPIVECPTRLDDAATG